LSVDPEGDFLVALKIEEGGSVLRLFCFKCKKRSEVNATIIIGTGSILLTCANHPTPHPFFRATIDVHSIQSLLGKLGDVLMKNKGNA